MSDYNGWTNYETWCVALWIDNDPGTYEQRREMARDAESVRELADALKVWVSEELCPELPPSLESDLLGAALSEVNWGEIAENYWDEEHEGEEA